MCRVRPALLILGFLLLVVPGLALTRTAAELEKNSIKLKEIRKDPDKLAHFQQLAHSFLALPGDRAMQLRQLDSDLHQLPKAYRKHLKQVLKKYTAWLNQLSAEKRQQIDNAKTKEARLELIKQFREQQWIGTLPKADREKLTEMKPEARNKEIVRLKKQQHKWEVEWQIALENWADAQAKDAQTKFKKNLAQLTPLEARHYATTYLRHLVPEERWQELEDAQGQWPWFPYLLVKLADDYPLALPNPREWPKSIMDLPEEIKTRLAKTNIDFEKILKPFEGKYPEFAGKVAALMDHKDLRPDYWPKKYQDLSLGVRHFLDQELKPILSVVEKEKLKNAEGKWPEFPMTIQKLAGKYFLAVPWQTLPPAPGKFWDNYRPKKDRAAEKVPALPGTD